MTLPWSAALSRSMTTRSGSPDRVRACEQDAARRIEELRVRLFRAEDFAATPAARPTGSGRP